MASVPHESRHSRQRSSLLAEQNHVWIAGILAAIVWIAVTAGFILLDTTWWVALMFGLVAAVVAYGAGERKLAVKADSIR
jgi:hypothetical protein